MEAINLAYIGDDENDIPCCSLIPFSFAVKDCHEDLKKISRFHLKVKGGEGVINGFINVELIKHKSKNIIFKQNKRENDIQLNHKKVSDHR